MIISVNWLKKYTAINLSIDELASLIGERLVEIESVIPLGQKYKSVVVARVAECAPLQGSDHLNLTKIDDGGVVQGVDRDEQGYVQVVCGAPNVRQGLLVAWLPPNSVVPETFGADEPFVLSSRPLRGAISHGMLASARELDLYDDHTGILEIDQEAQPGASFAELYELDDYLLDIENKSLTHRPETFGIIGFAREVAGIQGVPFTTPDWLNNLQPFVQPASEQVLAGPTIHIDQPQLSERFMAVVLGECTETTRSTILQQTYLARSGVRPVNALVDVSNYLMLLTGQPTHTYDYDKLRAVAGTDFSLHVRQAHPQETLQLLDGKTLQLDESDIVIAAGATAVGLAGIMGGKSTAVDSATKNVLVEAATFNLYSMRGSQMRHGIFSEAVTRFTKGIPAALGAPVLAQAATMLSEQLGAVVLSPVSQAYPHPYEPLTLEVSERRINQTLGTAFSAEDIASLLENVGFVVSFTKLTATITVPYWRKDITIAEDIIEEVGRLAGFDTINPTLPTRPFVAVMPEPLDDVRTHLRGRLVRAGANEVLTYSFVHGDILQKAGQDPSNAYKVINSISPDLQYYRQSLTPSLLAQVHPNSKAGFSSFALFELNKVHQKAQGLTAEQVPVEQHSCALVVTQEASQAGQASAYYQAKALLEYALEAQGITLSYQPLDSVSAQPITAPFEPKRSAIITATVSSGSSRVSRLSGGPQVILGVVGEYTPMVQKNFKLSRYTAGFEIDPQALAAVLQGVRPQYAALSRFPGSERDICFQVPDNTNYASVARLATQALEQTDLLHTVTPLDIYQAPQAKVKNITIRVSLTSYEKTMVNDEVTAVIQTIMDNVTSQIDGKVV